MYYSDLQPFLIGFLVVAGLTALLALATATALVADHRRRVRPVISISAAHPAVVAAVRRAA